MKLLNFIYTNKENLYKFINENSILDSNQTFIQIFYSEISNEQLIINVKDELLKLLPNSSLMGTSTAGVIKNDKVQDNEILISFSLFFKSTTTQNSYINKTSHMIIDDLKQNLIQKDTKLLIIFANTFTFNADDLLDKINQEFPNIVIAGGNSGDDFNFKKGFVFSKEANNVDISITAIHSKQLSVKTNYLLNWQTIGQNMTITKSKGNIIYEIDHKKAFDVYTEYLGKDISDNLPDSGIEFPLIFKKNGVEIARAVSALGEDNSLIVVGNVKEGTEVKFGFANIEYIEQNNLKLIKENEHYSAEGMYVYSCATRKKILDEFLDDELKLLNNISESSGFMTYGEFFYDQESCKNSLLNITSTYVTLNEDMGKTLEIKDCEKSKKSKKSLTLKALTHLVDKTVKTSHLLKQYKNTVDMNAMVSKTDANGKITYVNKIFEEISGYSQEELIGKSHNIIRHPDVSIELFKNLWKTIKEDKKPWFGKIKNRKKDGTTYYVDTVINPIFDENSNIIEYIAVRKDITDVMSQKKQMLNSLSIMKNPTLILTKISNYNFIKEFYPDKMLKHFKKEFSLYLFKFLKDSLDIKKVYVLADGSFGIIEDKLYKEHELSFKLNKTLSKIKLHDFEFENNKYELDLVFTYSFNKEHQYEDTLIAIENINKKSEVLNATNYYNISKNISHENLQTLALLKESLKYEERVVSFYQPIVDNNSLATVKHESLIRLITKDEEILTPYHFMDIAKKTGYYNDITYKVIENANKILSLNKYINISINLSSNDIEDTQVREMLLQLVSHKENKGRVTFELLEDEETNDLKTITEFIQLAKKRGDVKISIDDFGSGYSNYERLSLFQPDFIKIDGSLIKDITTNKYNESVIKSILVFANENNIKTIAEFVSSKEIYEKVKELGVTYSQGYYFGKPEPILI